MGPVDPMQGVNLYKNRYYTRFKPYGKERWGGKKRKKALFEKSRPFMLEPEPLLPDAPDIHTDAK